MITVSSLVNPQHIPPCIHMYFQTAHKSKFVFYKFHLQIVEGNWQNVTVRYLPTISKRRLESDELREIIKCLIHIITPTVIHIYILKPRANRQILNSLSYVLYFFSLRNLNRRTFLSFTWVVLKQNGVRTHFWSLQINCESTTRIYLLEIKIFPLRVILLTNNMEGTF